MPELPASQHSWYNRRENTSSPSITDDIVLTVSHWCWYDYWKPRLSPPLPTSPAITTEAVASEPLEHAQPLTQRALRYLRYLRQNARRAAEDIFFPTHIEPICDRLKTTQLTESDSILSTYGPTDKHDFTAQKSVTKKKECDDKANHRPFDCPLNPRTPRDSLLPPRAPHRRIMTSTTGNNKETPVVLISTANPASLSSYKGTDSAIASTIAPFLLRAAAGPEIGCSWDQRPSSSDYATLAAPPPHMKH